MLSCVLAIAVVVSSAPGPSGSGRALHLLEPSMTLSPPVMVIADHARPAADDDSEPGLPRALQPGGSGSLGGSGGGGSDRAVSETADESGAGHHRIGPWIGLGAGVVLGAVGSVFVARTADALAQDPTKTGQALSTTVTIPNANAIRQQEHDVFINGMLATVFISGAIAGLVTSLLMLAD